ncbi:transcriptional regulator [Bacteroidia bacterium]|nr:transcriptional regulator [Bacteroidia bacterium]
MVLNQHETVLTLLWENDGYLTAKRARENSVTYATLQRMARGGAIEKAVHGLYILPDMIPDPYFIAQYRCPKGVFSHETALFLLGLSDRVPFRLMVTIPSGWNAAMLTDPGMAFFYCKKAWIELGVCEVKTPSGRTVRVFDRERTLCDCLRAGDKLDRDLVLSAIKQYMKEPTADKTKLLRYAETFKVRDMVRQYMEVLS